MKIADGELRQLLTYDVKLPAEMVRELVADSKQTGRSLLQTVLASQPIDEALLARAQAKRLGVPFIDLQTTSISPKTLQRLPRQIATKYRVICFDETATSIKLAMADPRDEQARKAVKDYCNTTIRRYQATDRGLAAAIRSYPKSAAPLHYSTRELITTILQQALTDGSRDIHFDVQGNELLIKRRVNKKLQTMSTLPATRLRALISWCKLQAGNDVGDTERAHHGRFSIMLNGTKHDVIMSTIPIIDGEKLVLRLIPSAHSIPSLKAMGYTAKEVDAFEQLIQDGRGLVIVAGEHGSEAPTTRASLTKLATKRPHTMVTSIEDPLTYQIPGCTQTEVTTNLPFADAVSSAIAQNPDILITSQLGKGPAAEQLVDYALSQHMVITSLHANSLLSALRHITSYPLAPALMAASLRLIVVQHQIQALCGSCRTSFAPTGPLKTALWKQFNFKDETRLYRKGSGCNSCAKGHAGTVMVAEWLPITHDLQQLLATKADLQSIEAYIAEHSTFTKQLGQLASTGVISIDEAGRLAAHR